MVIYTLMRKNECDESAVSEWLKNRRHVVCKNVLRLAGELPIVRVLNDFQLLSILRIFCMRGFLPPPTDPPWLYASVSGLLCAKSRHC